MTYSRTVATWPSVLWAWQALHELPGLKPMDYVGQPGERRVHPVRKRGHAKGAGGCLGQHGQYEVLEVSQSGVASELGLQHSRQEFNDGDELDPRGSLLVVQPGRLHELRLPIT